MNYKAPLLIIIVAVAVLVLFVLPEKKIYEKVASVGSPAPEFEYPDANGKIWKLSDLRGKVVYMNFWATWCVTCKAEMPSKEALYEKMKDRPFQMLGMLFRDDPANLNDYYKIQKVSPPTLISPKNEAGKLYGITGVPETFIIDKDGIIREKIVGPRVWDSPEMVALMEKWM
jgi:peroxiredoxin